MGRNLGDLVPFVLGRLGQLLPVLIGVIAVTFVFSHDITSDPCGAWLPHAKPPVIRACIQYYGLDRPVWVQFQKYFVSLVSGHWGNDPNGIPVQPVVTSDLPATIELVLAALVIMVLVGIPLGVAAAAASGRWPDHAVRIFYLSGWSAPPYLVALILVIFVAPTFGIPSSGEFSSTPSFPQPTHFSLIDPLLAGNLPAAGDAFVHLLLPAAALAFLNLGIVTRMTRASMLEVLPADFIKSARMKGISEFRVLYRHALRNSLISTVTVLGFTASGLLAGTVVIEELFHWPGIGQYAYSAVTTYNFSGTIAVVIFFAIGVVIANLAADLLYGFLDPRVEWR